MKSIIISVVLSIGFLAYWGCENCPTCPENYAPVINEILINPPSVSAGDLVTLTAVVTDKDGDTITYNWSCAGGNIYIGIPLYGTTTNPARWRSPDTAGTYTITCIVSDGKDTNSKSISITVT